MNTPKVTPKDFFLWAGAMATLYVSVVTFATLLFEYIEKLVGDGAIIGYDPYSGALRFAIASLIVVFPVYLLLTRLLNQEIRKNPEKKELWVRRWLIFLTVFLSGGALIIDLVVLINTFLSGEEMTASFLLKVLAVLLLASGVFYYYLSDIKGKWEQNERASRFIGLVVATIVLISIISGFFIMGSPHTQRLIRYDSDRIDNLQNIQWQITDYYRSKQALPESLDDLKDPLDDIYIENDPETNKPYEYEKTGDLTFNICATFSLPSPKMSDDVRTDDWRKRELVKELEQWGHGAERTCFERTIDPDKYTPENLKPVFIR